MISVNVSFIGNDIQLLTVSGHANFDEYGKDIVCAGVSAIVQPGGSIRDKDSIALCNELNIPMVFTGYRHFRH